MPPTSARPAAVVKVANGLKGMAKPKPTTLSNQAKFLDPVIEEMLIVGLDLEKRVTYGTPTGAPPVKRQRAFHVPPQVWRQVVAERNDAEVEAIRAKYDRLLVKDATPERVPTGATMFN